MTAKPGRIGQGAALRVDIRLSRGTFALRVAFEVEAGSCLAILGPNGAGKTTILSVIAGLINPDRGAVVLGGRTLTEVGEQGAGLTLPPEHRRVGLMGQDPLLFPHLSALENVAFGPRSQGMHRREAEQRAIEWLDRMGLEQLAERRPAQLSGGQRQRVALARALAAHPDLLLLDEPLGALDARTAPGIRQVLRSHLRDTGTTSLLVTHDALDAAVLADRIIVLDGGEIVDDAAASAVLTAPRSEFGATLAGLNMIAGVAETSVPVDAVGRVLAPNHVRLAGVAAAALVAGQPAAAVFSPSAVAVYAGPVSGSPRNHWFASITGMQAGTAAIRLQTNARAEFETVAAPSRLAVDLTPAAVAELDLTVGSGVYLTVKATEVRIYPR